MNKSDQLTLALMTDRSALQIIGESEPVARALYNLRTVGDWSGLTPYITFSEVWEHLLVDWIDGNIDGDPSRVWEITVPFLSAIINMIDEEKIEDLWWDLESNMKRHVINNATYEEYLELDRSGRLHDLTSDMDIIIRDYRILAYVIDNHGDDYGAVDRDELDVDVLDDDMIDIILSKSNFCFNVGDIVHILRRAETHQELYDRLLYRAHNSDIDELDWPSYARQVYPALIRLGMHHAARVFFHWTRN